MHILDQEHIISKTEIGENCYIGFGVVIQAGTTLGRQCVVGANSVVKGSFPDFSVIVGAPGRVVKRYNTESEKWEKTDNKGEFII
jgi:acetyltransferase-like isoleucine patch superfamily enzyme